MNPYAARNTQISNAQSEQNAALRFRIKAQEIQVGVKVGARAIGELVIAVNNQGVVACLDAAEPVEAVDLEVERRRESGS